MQINYIDEIGRFESHWQLLNLLGELDTDRRIDWAAGKAFEHIILRAFQIEDAEVSWPFTVNLGNGVDEQIDGAVYCKWIQCLVESKDYSGRINFEPIAKLRTQLARRPPGTLGLVFARNDFTQPAKTLTRMTNPTNILLWEYKELEIALEQGCMVKALITKVRYAVERGIPDYNIIGGFWGDGR